MSLIRTNNRTLDGNQGRRNILYNGAMRVAQRGTTFDTLTNGDFCTDRWKIAFDGLDGNVDADQTTTVPTAQGFANSLQVHMDASETSLDAADQMQIHQRLEGQDLQHLLKGTVNAKKTVLSFWVRSSVASTYTVELEDVDNSRHISKSYTIDTADTWEKKVIVFDGDTTGTLDNDNARSMDVRWWIDAGSNFTSGTLATSWGTFTAANRVSQTTGWLESTSPEFYITGCQWEVGDNPSDFEHRTFGEELSLCQRYCYQHMEANGGGGGNSTEDIVCTASCYNTNTAYGIIQFPVTMRAAPTLDAHGGTNYWKFYNAASADLFNTFAMINATRTSGQIYNNQGIGITSGHSGNFQGGNTGNYIRFIAEI